MTFVKPVLFGYTFDEAGTYVFTNGATSTNQIIVTVMGESERCAGNARI